MFSLEMAKKQQKKTVEKIDKKEKKEQETINSLMDIAESNSVEGEIVTSDGKELEKIDKDSAVATFNPSKKMLSWVQTELEHPELTAVQVGQLCKVQDTSFYRWIRETPGFVEWRNDYWQKGLKIHVPHMDKIGIANSKKNFKYWERMQQRMGNLGGENASNGGNTTNIGIKVDFIDDGNKK